MRHNGLVVKKHCLCEDSKVARLASELVKEPLRGLFESTIQVCHLLSSRLFNHPCLGVQQKIEACTYCNTHIYIYIYIIHIISYNHICSQGLIQLGLEH